MLRRELFPGAVLRPPEEADAPALYATIDEDREALAPWLPWAAGQTEEATLAFIRAVRELASRFRGRGLITAGVRAYVDHAFDDLALHRVEIQAAVHNHASRAVAERAGFREEGIRREAERVGGRRYDLVVYGRLASDRRG